MEAVVGAMGSAIAGLLVYVIILANENGKKDKRIMDFVCKQEEGQQAYIAMLERIAENAIGELKPKGG